METRHFIDDERQITMSLKAEDWTTLQKIANLEATGKNWLSGVGSEYYFLNIWIIGRMSACPIGVNKDDWVRAFFEPELVKDCD
jgi:hypothetical protein